MRTTLRHIVLTCAVLLAPTIAVAQPVQILHAFGLEFRGPHDGVVEAPDGSLFGTTRGEIYRVAPDGALSIVHRLDSGQVSSRLTRGPDGVLYGTAYGGAAGRGLVFAFDPATGALRRLYEFAGADDGQPIGGVTFGPDALLYGATSAGGAWRLGTVYRVHPATGATTVFHHFRSGSDGSSPSNGLTLAADGRLYGATSQGAGGSGTLYRVDPATATVTTVLRWDAIGAAPEQPLTAMSDGTLYGTTVRGRTPSDVGFGGTVFRVDPASGSLTLIHAFGEGEDVLGLNPDSPLVQGPDGHLYGTTFLSRSGSVLFRVRRQVGGDTLEVVASYNEAASGHPAPSVLGRDGFLYGTSEGTGADRGWVVRFDPLAGGPPGNPSQFSAVSVFPRTDDPGGPLEPVLAADGRLYGMTSQGGNGNRGMIYRLTPATGAFELLGSVPGLQTFGGQSNSRFVAAPDGRLYGTSGILHNGADSDPRIISVDPATGAITTTLVWPDPTVELGGLTRLGDALYGIRDEHPVIHIFRFEPTTSAVNEVASFELGGFDQCCGFSDLVAVGARLCGETQAGITFATQTWSAYCVDPATGVLSPATFGVGSVRTTQGIAGGSDGRFYVAVTPVDGAPPFIAAHDPVAGTGRVVCTLPVKSSGAPSVAPDGGILGVMTAGVSTLFRCDPLTGVVTLLAPMPPTLSSIRGFVSAPDGLLYGAASAGGPGRAGALLRVSLTGTPPPIDNDHDGLSDTWEGTYGLNPSRVDLDDGPSGDPDHDGLDNAAELAAGTHPRGIVTRYLAEGATGSFFRTRLAIFNPTIEPATVLVRYLTDAHTVVPDLIVVPAYTRRTIDVDKVPGLASANFSTVVESDRAIVVDRTMSWDATGYGSHSETAMHAASPTWFLAEGSTSGDFSLFYLLQNPQTSAVTATVRYLRPFGLPPIVKTYVLPALSRTTIAVDAEGPELASTDVAAAIEATAPILVERAMYASRPGQPFAAGHDSAGVTEPALTWFLAEGATGPFFDMFVLVANPSPTPASISVEYLVLGGGVLTKDYVVPANGRFTIWVDDEQIPGGSGQRPLANAALSTTVRSTNGVPIIVERTMWWPGPEMTASYWYEAHNSAGSTTTAKRWAFAAGDVGGSDGTETYALVANPSASPGSVLVTAFFDDGTRASRTYDVPAKSRTNIPLSVDLPATLAHPQFGVVVESVGVDAVPIVVERATYASPGGITWASGSNALAVPLP